MKSKILRVLLATPLLAAALIFSINLLVTTTGKNALVSQEELLGTQSDCILIFGAGVLSNGTPSPMLRDRLLTGIACYQAGLAPKIVVSGDHGEDSYDEVNIMKNFCILNGVPSEDVFMDHAGFSTYESIYRIRDIFQAKQVILVTQEYHLYRALYVAKRFGLKAYGVSADLQEYAGQSYYDARELVARIKDFAYTLIFPKPTFLGEKISLMGNGDITNDKLPNH
jgi:vancomycin permeability regulator SanA